MSYIISNNSTSGSLPISIIVPLSENRVKFFEETCLPSLHNQNVTEIIIETGDFSAPVKRNSGAAKATQAFYFFCDDDIVLPDNYLKKLYDTLVSQKDEKTVYAYSDYRGIVRDPASHPMRGNFVHHSKHFNGDVLRQGNYISTMSLLKATSFKGFDESLKRLQDWDLWLNLWINFQEKGVYVPGIFFIAHYIDTGITSYKTNIHDAISIVKKKYQKNE